MAKCLGQIFDLANIFLYLLFTIKSLIMKMLMGLPESGLEASFFHLPYNFHFHFSLAFGKHMPDDDEKERKSECASQLGRELPMRMEAAKRLPAINRQS